MATENLGKCVSINASADLSSHQYKFVVRNSSNQIALAGASTDWLEGVLQDKPNAAGQPGNVMIGAGETKITLGATLSAGDLVMSNASGVAIAATGLANRIAGRLAEGGVSGDVVKMMFRPGAFVAQT